MEEIKFSRELTIKVTIGPEGYREPIVAACEKLPELEYVGKMVYSKNRRRYDVVKYHGTYFTSMRWSAYKNNFSIVLELMEGSIDDYEPYSNYKYRIEYCIPELDCEKAHNFYYKSDELEQARERQKFLGVEYAFLFEI